MVRVSHLVGQRFGLRVKELRSAREITREELAERVGVFRTYMSRIETCAANPTLTTVHALAESLDVDVAVLFESPGGIRADAGASTSTGVARSRPEIVRRSDIR